eukprot:19992-Heterococcus_DN1.PRE.2
MMRADGLMPTGASYGHVLGALGGDLSLAPQLLQTMTDEGTAPDLQRVCCMLLASLYHSVVQTVSYSSPHPAVFIDYLRALAAGDLLVSAFC